MFQERNQRSGYTHRLLGRNIDIFYIAAISGAKLAVNTGKDATFGQTGNVATSPGFLQHLWRSQDGFHFLVGTKVDDFVLVDLAVLDTDIRRVEEAIIVDARVDTHRTNQANVIAFRRLDGTNSAVVTDVDVANFKPSPLAVQPARA